MAKKALCVGINDYPFGEANDLRGCVNDANNWASLLKNNFGFTEVKQLINEQATKANIIKGIKSLLKGAKSGDILVFTNASHGTYHADSDGDESKFDEAICPCDTTSDLLVDDELRKIFKKIPDGVQLTVISDSCHSGSVTRKPGTDRRNRHLDPRVFGGTSLTRAELQAAREKKEKHPESKMKEILLSGCKSNQTSADAYIAGDYHGAMSYYAIEVIKEAGNDLTYEQLHRRLVKKLEEGNYGQEPQLEGTDDNKRRKVFT